MKVKGMTVDKYKKKYGLESLQGFFRTTTIVHECVISLNLYNIINEMVAELNKIYIPFACQWVMEHKPKIREEIKEIEENINVAVLCKDERYLRSELKKYYEVWLEAIMKFGMQKEKFIPF